MPGVSASRPTTKILRRLTARAREGQAGTRTCHRRPDGASFAANTSTSQRYVPRAQRVESPTRIRSTAPCHGKAVVLRELAKSVNGVSRHQTKIRRAFGDLGFSQTTDRPVKSFPREVFEKKSAATAVDTLSERCRIRTRTAEASPVSHSGDARHRRRS